MITDWENRPTRAIYTRVPVKLLQQIHKDARRQQRTIARVISQILEAHYANQEVDTDGKP